MFDEKTDNINSFKRAIALKAIASKAEELKNKGTAPFEIQSFINDSRGEVAKRIPDIEMHGKAVRAAAMQKNTRS